MNMMRFILDCLRPARARAAAADRDSVELQAQVKDDDTEIKNLKDALDKEVEALQRVKTSCCEMQEAVDNLKERKSQLREELEMIQHLEKQEREVLQLLQEEQQELEQTIQQYDAKLHAAGYSVLQLQEEVACAKAHAQNMRVQIVPLQDSFEEILKVKKKLDELIAGLVTDESLVPDISEEAVCEEADVEEHDLDNNYREETMSKQETDEVDYAKQESTVEEPGKMQCSTENLKCSGSSSFTEITLTESKEDNVMFRSTSPQLDVSDMEEEDIELVKPCHPTNTHFDFFHPNPFTDGDVFGDDHFQKADITECLPRDPFKGTDPFASDMLFVDIFEEKYHQDSLLTAENSLPETVHCPLQSVVFKDKDYGTFNTLPLDAHFKQSTEKVDQSVSLPTESLKSCSDVCLKVETNPIQDQIFAAVQPNLLTKATSPQLDENGIYNSPISHSSTESDSLNGEYSTFAAVEEEDRVEIQDEFSFTGKADSLCGLQKIIEGTYTEFPLSPCDPEPYLGIINAEKTFVHLYNITPEQNAASVKDCLYSELGNDKSSFTDYTFNDPGSSFKENEKDNDEHNHPNAVDAYDYKYGDMFFFTVRLDPGSPELPNPTPGCPESSDVNKYVSLIQMPCANIDLCSEFNDTDEFKCCAPKIEEHNLITYDTKADSGVVKYIPDSSVLDTEVSTPFTEGQARFTFLSNAEISPSDQLSASEKVRLESCNTEQHVSDCSERLTISKSELQYFDPFSPISAESVDCVNEFEGMYTKNSVSHIATRLDSGYHEVDNPTPFSQEPIDTSKCSINSQGPCLETSKESNSELCFLDSFSPISADTGIFDSEIENCDSDYMTCNCQSISPQSSYSNLNNPVEKQTYFFNIASHGVMSSHLSESNINDCYPIDSLSHQKDKPNAESTEENVVPGSIQDRLTAHRETKSLSMASNVLNLSQVNHHSSKWKTSEITPEVFDSVKDSVFEFSSTPFESCVCNINKQAEESTNCAVNVIKMSDHADIDYFCSELSKMVSSRSSDFLQQSVTEMLFGSDPNTSSFYPWDFEKQQHSS